MGEKFRYEEFTWPEIRDAAAQNRAAVVPVGTVEQHGPHLPLATDLLAALEIARLAVKRIPGEAVLLPAVPYGSSAHQMDFPGAVSVESETVVRYLTGLGISLARHGFGKILLVNVDRANAPLLDVAAREVTRRTESLCAAVMCWNLVPPPLAEELRDPAGIAAHAGELESSVMLYLRGDLVRMQEAEPEAGGEPLSPTLVFDDWPSRCSRTGTLGDPTGASAEMGRRIVEAVVSRLVEVIAEFRAREIRPRADRH